MSGLDDHPLLDALAVAVPLEIRGAAAMEPQARELALARLRPPWIPGRREFPDQESWRRAQQAALKAAEASPFEHFDDLLYGGRGCVPSFAALSRGLAILACRAGGVRVGPLGWCASHYPGGTRRWPEGQRNCPACLREEREARQPVERVAVAGSWL